MAVLVMFRRWYAEHYGRLVFGLTLLAIGMGVAIVLKEQWITAASLVARRDLIDVLTKLLTASVVLGGAVLSYFRFFRGRTLAPRLEVTLSPTVMDGPGPAHLHVLSIEAKNVGPVALRDLQPLVELHQHTEKGDETSVIREWFTPFQDSKSGRGSVAVVDTGETAQFFTRKMVDKEVWAVTYIVKIGTRGDVSWARAETVPNAPVGTLQYSMAGV